jgi:phospholipid N-methyltransferase
MLSVRMNWYDRAFFLFKFLQSPRTVGSITPSSQFLAEKMLEPIDWSTTRSIVELGAGTGIFTRLLNKYKHPDCVGMVFEYDQALRTKLQHDYPDLHCFSNAKDIKDALNELNISEVDCIISGLPFNNFEQDLRDKILEGVLRSLKPGGLFITFQYSLQMKKQLATQFDKVNISFVPLNIPPAFVYTCRKAAE